MLVLLLVLPRLVMALRTRRSGGVAQKPVKGYIYVVLALAGNAVYTHFPILDALQDTEECKCHAISLQDKELFAVGCDCTVLGGDMQQAQWIDRP
jgi:hypothetical protein